MLIYLFNQISGASADCVAGGYRVYHHEGVGHIEYEVATSLLGYLQV